MRLYATGMALELGNQPPMPLDFSSSGTRGSSSPVDVDDSRPTSPQGNSAFRVVTPKGRDGKSIRNIFSKEVAKFKKGFE